MSESPRRVLLISSSARALARSAHRAGWKPLVLDLFADQDTCALATAWRRLPIASDGGSAEKWVCEAQALDPTRSAALAYGSGLEAAPEVIEALASDRCLLGNTAAVVATVKEPQRLATLLAELGVPHPEISSRPPAAPDGWLLKEAGGSGGLHVSPARVGCSKPSAGCYFQRRVSGRVLGVTFLAAAGKAEIVGFAEQLIHRRDAHCPFVYGGAIALENGQLSPSLRATIADALDTLVQASGLRGLCGADLIEDGERWWLIEVNPRPGASFELHERHRGLFAAHAEACRGHAVEVDRADKAPCRGLKIVFNERPFRLPAVVEWPDWVSDRPWPESDIGSGEPLCTVHASAHSSAAVGALLESRCVRLTEMAERWRRVEARPPRLA